MANVVRMALLIIYKVCVWLGDGVGDCLPNYVPRAMVARFFLAFIAKQNWIWKAMVLRKQTYNNVFVKPNEQCRACSDIVMARKRTFRGTRKEQFSKSNYV